MIQFHQDCLVTRVTDDTTAGTSTISSGSVDMTDFDSVAFFSVVATQASNNTVHGQISVDDSTWKDLKATDDTTVTKVATAADGDIAQLVMHRPTFGQYVRAVFERGTSTALGEIWAVRYNARDVPVTQPATTITSFLNNESSVT